MRVLSMRVENFLSFKEAEFDFSNAGLVFVEGENLDDDSAQSNGSGKSAMIDALVWCLFGTTLRGYENDEVVHRRVGEDCGVTVQIDGIDGCDVVQVFRARRHSKHKNALILSTQGANVGGASNAETQEILERLIGCSLRTFLSSVVFGQDRAYRFSQLTDKEQKEVLDEVLGVERFAEAGRLARDLANAVETSWERLAGQLEKAEKARDEAEAEVADFRGKDTDFESDRATRVETERERLRTAKKWIRENKKAALDVEGAKLGLTEARKGVTDAETKLDKVSARATEARVGQGAVNARVRELQTHVQKHLAGSGDCPTCGRPMTDAKKSKKALADLRAKVTEVEAEAKAAAQAVSDADDEHDRVKKRLKQARDAVITAEKAYNEATGAVASIKAWEQRAADAERRVAEIEAEGNPYAKLIEKAETKLKRLVSEAELFGAQVLEEDHRLRRARFWVDAYGTRGLRSLLLDTSLPLLNDEAARISRAVTGGTISIEFCATSDLKSGKTIDRFEVRVDNRHGAGSYLGNSAGERAKVDLCVGLALQRLVASRSKAAFNVMFADEIFDHLDAAAHERVVEVLSELDKESVYVVSHNDDLRAFFPHAIKIVKQGGFSRVED